MKICPQCEAGYPDELTTCPVHGGLLSEIRDLKPGMLVRGTYRIVRKLNQGGMGHVYLAHHILLNELQVLKFLSGTRSRDKEWTDRFLREVRTLRQIRHPNVVTAGNLEPAEDGTLFFSMEYVDGPNLMELFRHAPKPFDVALALTIMRGAAEGLGAAHALGVVHRDVKPENILIANEHDRLVAKIADFGIVATQDVTRLTQGGTTLLTPQFAAPEQWVEATHGELDGRTDLYALGGVLFEILTGRCAFDARKYQDWAAQHLYSVPSKPSALRPELAGWRGLDELVLQLLAKDPKDRPQNVDEMLRLLKSIEYVPRQRRAKPAEAMHEEAPCEPPAQDVAPTAHEEAAELVLVAAGVAGPAALAESGRTRVRVEPMPIWEPMQPRSAVRPRALLQETEQEKPTPASRSYAQAVLAVLVMVAAIALGIDTMVVNPVHARVLAGQRGAIVSLAFSPNGLHVASASRDGTVQVWNVSDGRALGELDTNTDALAYSPSGHTIATGTAGDDTGYDHTGYDIDLWDDSRALVLATLQGATAPVSALAFSPDGRTLAAGSWDQSVRLWDVSSGRLLHTLNGSTGRVFSLAFSPDGHTLASAGADRTVRLWDPGSGAELRDLQGHTGAVHSVAFSPNGSMLISAGDDGTLRLWKVSTGQTLRVLQGQSGAVLSAACSPDGSMLASGHANGTVKLWDLQSGALLRTLKGHKGPVNSVAFSPFGTILASGSTDKTVRLWKIANVGK